MQLDGRDLLQEPGGVSGGGTQYETSSWPLPLSFRTGVGWHLIGDQYALRPSTTHDLLIAADAKHLNEGVTTVHFGAEYGFGKTVFLRGGRTLGHDSETWAFGVGVRANLYEYQVSADFGYSDLGDLNTIQRVTLSVAKR